MFVFTGAGAGFGLQTKVAFPGLVTLSVKLPLLLPQVGCTVFAVKVIAEMVAH